MTKINNIAKNTSYFTLALILQKIISFSYFIILARFLGPADLGKYYFAISFTSLFAIIIDIGLANVLVREFARFGKKKDGSKNHKITDLVRGTMAIKIFLSIISLLAVISIINLMGYPELTKSLVYLSAICMVLDSFTASFFAMIRGFHNLIFESISSVIFQLITLTLGITFLNLGLSLRWVMGALVSASVFNFSYSFILVTLKWKINLIPKWSKGLAKQIIILTSPFAFFAIFQRAYFYLDSVLLSILSGDRAVGIYQVPFKIIYALQFLPLAFVASLYPAMSSYWLNNKKQLAISFERAMHYLIIISIPISAGVIVLADKIILLFKSGFNDAIIPMQIIMLAVFFIFINFPIGSLLNATERQKINTYNMIAVTITSVVLNIILIPKFSAIGASITVLITNFMMFVLGIYWVPKLIDFKVRQIFSFFLKALFSALIMAFTVFYLKDSINLFLVVLIGAFIYALILLIVGGIKIKDIKSIINSFLKKSA